MAQRSIVLLLGSLALTVGLPTRAAANGELTFGCWTRPACGKVCKLVCETTTLTSVCYGAECTQICVPGPSCQGCKHCDVCCGECTADPCGCCNDCQPCTPECKFCWYDWRSLGWAKPRTVKLLTKYEAQKEVCWYHWEVVDACDCGCNDPQRPGCGCVYKPAPADAELGATAQLSDEERAQLVAWETTESDAQSESHANAEATAGGTTQSLWHKVGKLFGGGKIDR